MKEKGKQGLKMPMGNAHWEEKPGETMTSDLKYTSGEMSNPEHLKKSVNELSSYVKKNKMSY